MSSTAARHRTSSHLISVHRVCASRASAKLPKTWRNRWYVSWGIPWALSWGRSWSSPHCCARFAKGCASVVNMHYRDRWRRRNWMPGYLPDVVNREVAAIQEIIDSLDTVAIGRPSGAVCSRKAGYAEFQTLHWGTSRYCQPGMSIGDMCGHKRNQQFYGIDRGPDRRDSGPDRRGG